jgi:uncharacterized membrane protein
MNFSICLDQTTTPNFNVANLSTTGFSIYSNLNLNSPLVQNIPYTSLFESPLGTCPFNLTNIPEGTDYLIVVDQCNTSINVSSIFAPENINAGSITINCCYAIINLNPTPLSICDECNLSFDTFSTSTVGRIIAGTLSSTCGAITDYTIGWYRNGSTTPSFVSGIGTTLSYNFSHPLVGNTSPMVLDGSWIGIIHDIIMNGITYSSVAGVLGGSPLPFTSCFDTMVVAPFSCTNGQNPPPYSHQISFTAVGNNSTPPPISATYALSSSTNHFAYKFTGFEVPDVLSIKFISGNPNGTNDPSLYSQPIWLENISVGSSNLGQSSLLFLNPPPNYVTNTNGCILDNTYPKIHNGSDVKRVFTLTNLSRSLNDKLEITVTPSNTNPNTSWNLQMQCLDTFGCDDCLEPFPKVKLSKLKITYDCCGVVKITLPLTSSACTSSMDKWTYGFGWNTINSIGSPYEWNIYPSPYPTQGNPQCFTYLAEFFPNNTTNCSVPTPNSTIKYHKSTRVVSGQTQGVISMSFNNVTDYNYYKTKITAGSWTNFSINIDNSYDILNPYDIDNTNVNYYAYYKINLPTSTEACGDGSPFQEFRFHKSGYPLIEYVDNPTSGNDYTITIPMPVITNGITASNCNSIQGYIQTQVNEINQDALSQYNSLFPLNVTNTFGSKSNNILNLLYNFISTGNSNLSLISQQTMAQRVLGYYSMNTLPFISSSNGWTNLPSLGGTPCPDYPISSSMPAITPVNSLYYANEGREYFYFTQLTGSNLNPPYSHIKIFTQITSSDGSFFSPPQLIYEYSNSIATVYSSSYFVNGSLDLQFAYSPSWPC